MKYNKSAIMTRAHEIRKSSNPRITMSDALRASWKIAKEGKHMKGSEKQIKWANDIISSARAAIKSGTENAKKYFPEEVDLWEGMNKTYETHIATLDSASAIIDNRKGLDGAAIVYKMGKLRDMRAHGVKITW